MYLVAILKLGSRRIVGWSMSERINADLVCQSRVPETDRCV